MPSTGLELYQSKTKTLRNQSLLFISFVKPYGPVTSSTIARKLRETLLKASNDTSIFKAHSIRGVSTSRAANVGVTTEDILKAADWSAESTFQKFYYKPSTIQVLLSQFFRVMSYKITIDMWDWAFWNINTEWLRPQSGWMLFWVIWRRRNRLYFYLTTPITRDRTWLIL